MASANPNRLTRDEFRKAKELEELRKTGAAPPEIDAEGNVSSKCDPLSDQSIVEAPEALFNSAPIVSLCEPRNELGTDMNFSTRYCPVSFVVFR